MGDGDSYITLNVGGICYTTSLLTLRSFPDSMLGTMFGDQGGVPQPDNKGHFFIDRDGTMFRYILNFMRDRKLCLPSGFEEYNQLLAEAEFFQLSGLKEEISRMKDPVEKEVVILRKFSKHYEVEAEKQTWSKLKSLGPKAVESDQVHVRKYFVPRPMPIFHDSEKKAYKVYECVNIVALLMKDGFKCEKSVPPDFPADSSIFTNI